jgi:hypothetical protein
MMQAGAMDGGYLSGYAGGTREIYCAIQRLSAGAPSLLAPTADLE